MLFCETMQKFGAVPLCSALQVKPVLPFAIARGGAGGWICRLEADGLLERGSWVQEAVENGETPGKLPERAVPPLCRAPSKSHLRTDRGSWSAQGQLESLQIEARLKEG